MSKRSVATKELEEALKRHSLEGVRAALERGADPNALFKTGSALCLALEPRSWDTLGRGSKPWELANALLDAGAHVRLSDHAKKFLAPTGELPLNKAIGFWGEPEGETLCERLLTMRADPNAKDQLGHTAAHCLASKCLQRPQLEEDRALKAWALLIKDGANLKIKNKAGRSPLDDLKWSVSKSMMQGIASLEEGRSINKALGASQDSEALEANEPVKRRRAAL